MSVAGANRQTGTERWSTQLWQLQEEEEGFRISLVVLLGYSSLDHLFQEVCMPPLF